MIQAYLKGKLVVQENEINKNEDFKTSSAIGLLQYLPDELFWEIIRDSCSCFPTIELGKVISCNFWAHTDATDTSNSQLVEPDVWIETEFYDVIIEAKISDFGGQYLQQWQNEIQSILNEHQNNNYNKKIILIALGGNENMNPESVLTCPIYKASWNSLLNAVNQENSNKTHNGAIHRILDDVIELFARQGMMVMKWMSNLPYYDINGKALDNWKTVKGISCAGLGIINVETISYKNLQQWRPIN